MPRQFTVECDELRRWYDEERLGVAAIAGRLGCSPPTVSNMLRRCAIVTRPGRFVAREVPADLLRQLYSVERLPLRAIAERLGVSVGTINNRRRAYAIPARGRAGHGRPA